MKKISKTVVFFGNERLATGVSTSTPTLHALVKSGYTIAAIISNNTPGSSRSVRSLEVESFAREHNIPILFPEHPRDILDQLRAFNAAVGVLAAYGKIVPQSIIDIFPGGIINIHPSRLPLHRGPTPIESVILDGSKVTAVSLMQLVKEMDAGPVYRQEIVRLKGDETKQQLADNLGEIGSKMVVKLLPEILARNLEPTPQDNKDATYDNLIEKSSGTLDWTKSAEDLEREIRAYIGWPGSRTTLGGKDVIITEARAIADSGSPGTITFDKKQLIVYARHGALDIKRLKPLGKSEMDAQQFLAGYSRLL